MLRRVFIVMFVLLFAAVGGGAWYVYAKGFTKKWRAMVTEECRKRGFEVAVRRLTYVPFRGLTARGVTIRDARDVERVLAEVDRVRLVVNFADLARGRSFLEAIELDQTSLALPLDARQPNGEKLLVKNLSGELFLPPQQLFLKRLEADLFGLHFTASGQLLNPGNLQQLLANTTAGVSIGGNRKPGEKGFSWQHFARLEFTGSPPRLDVHFSGDVNQPETLQARLALRGEKMRLGSWEIGQMTCDADYRNKRLTVAQFTATDHLGAMNATGTYNTETREVTARVRSNLDLQGVARALSVFPEVQEFRFIEPPALRVSVDGRAVKGEGLKVVGHVGVRRFEYRGVVLDRAHGGFAWDGEKWSVRELRVARTNGGAYEELVGDVLSTAGDFRVKIESNLHLDLLRPFLKGRVAEIAREIAFTDTPYVYADLRGPRAGLDGLSGLVALYTGRASWRGLGLQKLEAKARFDGSNFEVERLHLVRNPAEIFNGVASSRGGVFSAKLDSTLNPEGFFSLLSGKVAEKAREFEFPDPPRIEATMSGPAFQPEKWTGTATARTGRATYRGYSLISANAAFKFAPQRLDVENFHVQRAEGVGGGTLRFDFVRDEVKVEGVRSSVFPQEIMQWIDRKLVRDLEPYRWGSKPPNATVEGVIHRHEGPTTRLFLTVDAPHGMTYRLMGKDLRMDRISTKLFFTSEKLRITDFEGSLFGGRVSGDADISTKKNQPGHQVDLQISDVDFESLTKLYFGYSDSKGRIDGAYRFSGRGEDERAMRGSGQLTVRDGKVFAIPFLGPLSTILNSIVPGMGVSAAKRATASFEVGEGEIKTDNLSVEGAGFVMNGGGRIDFADDEMQMMVKINARGLPGVLLFPVSKLFEYEGSGSPSNPKWGAVNIPSLTNPLAPLKLINPLKEMDRQNPLKPLEVLNPLRNLGQPKPAPTPLPPIRRR